MSVLAQMAEALSFTSPQWGEVGAQRRVRGPRPLRRALIPLTRSASPIDLSPRGRGEGATRILINRIIRP